MHVSIYSYCFVFLNFILSRYLYIRTKFIFSWNPMAIKKNSDAKPVEYNILCLRCKVKTKHAILSSIVETWSENNWDWEFVDKFQIIQCEWCETTSFRKTHTDSEDYYYVEETWECEYIQTETLYPKRHLETLELVKFKHLPSDISNLYNEVIESYNNEILTLCGVWVRAVVECICISNWVNEWPLKNAWNNGAIVKKRSKSLQGMINWLAEQWHLSERQATALHENRFLGNESAHQFIVPSKKDLYMAIKIIEGVLNMIYEIPLHAESLEKWRVKRTIGKKII